MDKKLAPIVLFVYNRLWHTKQTVEALQKNELANESTLFIYSDGVKNEDTRKSVDEIRDYISSIDGFKKVTVIKREKNWGLAANIIDGVTKIVNEYGEIIVLEDDLVTSKYFLRFMNEALDFYIRDDRVFVISGHSHPVNIPKKYKYDVYLGHRSSSWGWATWRKEWLTIEWDNSVYKSYLEDKKLMIRYAKKGGTDRPKMLKQQIEGKINSWAVRRGFTQFLQKKYTIFPVQSLISNIGHDGSGVHCGINKSRNAAKINKSFLPALSTQGIENDKIHRLINMYHSVSLIPRIVRKIKRILDNE